MLLPAELSSAEVGDVMGALLQNLARKKQAGHALKPMKLKQIRIVNCIAIYDQSICSNSF